MQMRWQQILVLGITEALNDDTVLCAMLHKQTQVWITVKKFLSPSLFLSFFVSFVLISKQILITKVKLIVVAAWDLTRMDHP